MTFPIIIIKLWCSECSDYTMHLLTIWLNWECLKCRSEGHRSIKPTGILCRQDYQLQGVTNVLPEKDS